MANQPDPHQTDPGRPWTEADLAARPDLNIEPTVQVDKDTPLAADMVARGLTLNPPGWHQGQPIGDPPKANQPTPEERLDAIEDFLATLPPGLATYAMGHYKGPDRIQAINNYQTKHNAIKGRADDRQRQRDRDKPDPGNKPGPNDPT